jgi:hypothetical protein
MLVFVHVLRRRIRMRLAMSRLFAYFLFGMFGVGPWLLLSGIYAQLPVFITALPESASIAAYIIFIAQVVFVIDQLLKIFALTNTQTSIHC